MMLITSVYETGNRKTLFIKCESEKKKKGKELEKNPINHCLKDRMEQKEQTNWNIKNPGGSLERVFEQRDLKGPGLKYWD